MCVCVCVCVCVSLSLLNKRADFHEKFEANIIPHLNLCNQLHEDECVGVWEDSKITVLRKVMYEEYKSTTYLKMWRIRFNFNFYEIIYMNHYI